MNEFPIIHEILDSGTNDDKIGILESLSQSSDQKIINKIITKLDDSEIEVRGEAFILKAFPRWNVRPGLQSGIVGSTLAGENPVGLG